MNNDDETFSARKYIYELVPIEYNHYVFNTLAGDFAYALAQAIRAALQQQAHVVADAEAALKARLLEIGGCSNHGCYIVKPVGQGTNGPCHCLDDRYKAKRVVGAYHAALSAAKDGA